MSLHVALHHRTQYRYDKPIHVSPQIVRLRPAPHTRTPILSYSLNIRPEPHFLNWQQDPLGNYLARLVFPEKVTEFSVEVDLVANLVTINPFDFFLEPSAAEVPFVYGEESVHDLAPYRVAREAGPLLRKLVEEVRPSGVRTVDALVAINQRVQQEVRYLIRLEPGMQSQRGNAGKWHSGSCRDSAWLLVPAFAPSRAGRAFCVRLSDPAEAGRETAGGPAGAAPISPTCTPGPRSICPARAGWAWTRPPACWRARATSRWPAPEPSNPRRRSPASTKSARWKFDFEMSVRARVRGPALHQALYRRAVASH
jgi:hypothetical protein